MKEKYHLRASFRSLSRFLRDRPFNLKGGLWFRIFFFPEFNIRFYDKKSESDYFFFPPPKSEYFFQQHWESEYFQVKWSFPYFPS